VYFIVHGIFHEEYGVKSNVNIFWQTHYEWDFESGFFESGVQ